MLIPEYFNSVLASKITYSSIQRAAVLPLISLITDERYLGVMFICSA